MTVYPWVSEGSIRKLDRAITALKKANLEVTEQAVKDLYIKYGGLLMPEDAVVEEEKVEEVEEEKPRRGRPSVKNDAEQA